MPHHTHHYETGDSHTFTAEPRSTVPLSGNGQQLPTVDQVRALATTQTITGAGLITGGGDLSVDRTLTVAEATDAEMDAATSGSVAVTPRRLASRLTRWWDSIRTAALTISGQWTFNAEPRATVPRSGNANQLVTAGMMQDFYDNVTIRKRDPICLLREWRENKNRKAFGIVCRIEHTDHTQSGFLGSYAIDLYDNWDNNDTRNHARFLLSGTKRWGGEPTWTLKMESVFSKSLSRYGCFFRTHNAAFSELVIVAGNDSNWDIEANIVQLSPSTWDFSESHAQARASRSPTFELITIDDPLWNTYTPDGSQVTLLPDANNIIWKNTPGDPLLPSDYYFCRNWHGAICYNSVDNTKRIYKWDRQWGTGSWQDADKEVWATVSKNPQTISGEWSFTGEARSVSPLSGNDLQLVTVDQARKVCNTSLSLTVSAEVDGAPFPVNLIQRSATRSWWFKTHIPPDANNPKLEAVLEGGIQDWTGNHIWTGDDLASVFGEASITGILTVVTSRLSCADHIYEEFLVTGRMAYDGPSVYPLREHKVGYQNLSPVSISVEKINPGERVKIHISFSKDIYHWMGTVNISYRPL